MGRITAKVRCGTALEMKGRYAIMAKLRKEALCHENFNYRLRSFGGETVNPAYEAVKLLPDTIAGAEIIKLKSQRFHRAGAVLENASAAA